MTDLINARTLGNENLGGFAMKDKMMNGFLMFATKIQGQRHINAIKNGFTNLMPIIIETIKATNNPAAAVTLLLRPLLVSTTEI